MEWIGYESVLIVFTPALLLILLNCLYQKIRRKFNYKVNCWFCNKDTKVPYEEINGFICPSCSQYNGFTKDGSYNKQIPEQHDELLNIQHRSSSPSGGSPTNGLCKFCNNNQQLKIYQLAHFVPLNEENYDIEIEHFQKQLEKAYKLCPKCDKVLKRTLNKQSKWMLGLKLAYLKKKGAAILNETIAVKENRHWFVNLLGSLLLLFYLFALAMAVPKYSKDIKLSSYVPEALKPTLKNATQIATSYGLNSFWDNYMPVLAIAAILLPLTLFASNRKSRINKKPEVQLSPKKLRKLEEDEVDFPLNSTDLSSDPESDYESFNASMMKRKHKRMKKKAPAAVVRPPKPLFETMDRSQFNLQGLFSETPSDIFAKQILKPYDLNLSLGALKLSPKKPVLSPPKFRNPWASGATSVASCSSPFWDTKPDFSESRSSSQSSGFISSCPDPPASPFTPLLTMPDSRCNSICGDFGSLYSEPVHHSFGQKSVFLFAQRRRDF